VPKETRQENTKREQDRELDRELEDTFPASDPPNITRVPYERRFTSEPPSNDDQVAYGLVIAEQLLRLGR
jgi:hypothetical protein